MEVGESPFQADSQLLIDAHCQLWGFFFKASNVHIGHCESKGKTGMFEGKQLGMEIFGARNVVKKGWRTDQSRCLQLWICVCLSATPTNKINLARTHLKTLPDDAHDNIPDFIGPWIFHASNACCIVNQLWSLDNNKISFPPYYIKLWHWDWPKKDVRAVSGTSGQEIKYGTLMARLEKKEK